MREHYLEHNVPCDLAERFPLDLGYLLLRLAPNTVTKSRHERRVLGGYQPRHLLRRAGDCILPGPNFAIE